MYSYTVVDAHCDTISELYRPLRLYQNDGHLDIKRLKAYKNWLQFFALWAPPQLDAVGAFQRCETIIRQFHEQLARYSAYIEQVANIKEIESAFGRRKIGAFLTLEGGVPIGGDLAVLDWFYAQGVRCIAPTWNNSNLLGTGAGEEDPVTGLTSLGKQAVSRMNALGIIVDVSHLSEKSFWDVAQDCAGPFAATHSNARKICDHRRNLTDEQFLAVVRAGGVVGMNMYPLFVTGGKKAGIDDLIRHIEHFLSLGGADNIGLGCDFDGIDYGLEEIKGAEHVYLLFDRMRRMNYPDSLIAKIASENFLGLIKAVCR